MRVEQHPILDVDRKPDTYILYDGKKIPAVTGEPIAAALIAAGGRTMRYTAKQHTARSIFCGIGRCNDCKMIVNGVPNTRTCDARRCGSPARRRCAPGSQRTCGSA